MNCGPIETIEVDLLIITFNRKNIRKSCRLRCRREKEGGKELIVCEKTH